MAHQGYLTVYRADDADFFITKHGSRFGIFKLYKYFSNIHERRVFGKRVYTIYHESNNPSSMYKAVRDRDFEKELENAAFEGKWIIWSRV